MSFDHWADTREAQDNRRILKLGLSLQDLHRQFHSCEEGVLVGGGVTTVGAYLTVMAGIGLSTALVPGSGLLWFLVSKTPS